MSDIDNTTTTPPSQGTGGGEPKFHGLAIASLVCGIAGIFCYGATSIVGLILGIIGRNKIKENPSEFKGEQMALAGIITSVVCLVLGIIFGILMIGAMGLAVFSEM